MVLCGVGFGRGRMTFVATADAKYSITVLEP